MYAGHDKFGGHVVGTANEEGDLQDALEGAAIEETLVVAPSDIGLEGAEGQEVLLSAKLNPREGGLVWQPEQNASGMYKSVIAMSQMTSMMHDVSRNTKYDAAITAAVHSFIARHGRKPLVLDVGTGTGLLAMMAVRAGAEHVYACEVFKPLAALAARITAANCGSAITVLSKLSEELVVGPGGDMPRKADMLISEILDSALLGEGVLPFLRHALTHLVVPDAIVVPQRATVFAQLIDCPCIAATHEIPQLDFTLFRTPRSARCSGGRPLLPVHVPALSTPPKPMSPMIALFDFDFCTPSERRIKKRVCEILLSQSGSVHGVLLHWELVLFDNITYSTAPGRENWQDHWLCVIAPLPTLGGVTVASEVVLNAFYDDTSMWFSLAQQQSPAKRARPATTPLPTADLPAVYDDDDDDDICGAPSCSCGWHTLCTPQRLTALADRTRTSAIKEALVAALARAPPDTVCLDVSDGSLCALMLAQLQAPSVVSVEAKPFSRLLADQLVSANQFDDRLEVTEEQCWTSFSTDVLDGRRVGLLCAEPFYFQMQNFSVYQALNFWHIRTLLETSLAPGAIIVPLRAALHVALVVFDDLGVSHGTVGSVCGFDHSLLDVAQTGWHLRDFPYPVGMYRHRLVSPVHTAAVFEFALPAQDRHSVTQLHASTPSLCHGVVSWVSYALDETHSINTAPTGTPDGHKQIVRFFPSPRSLAPEDTITVTTSYSASEGTLSLVVA
eukprot:m.176483 g.176483  ORF g.176483 m.176483 type:complete len:729 (-) comp15340_c0_seq2:361-2547(-)